MALLMMAQSNSKKDIDNIGEDVKPTIFHDFLSKECASLPAAGDVRPSLEAVPATSASVGTSSGGGRGPISSTSDLGSERQAGNHIEGVPFYGLRSDFTGSDIARRFTGNKRGNSECTFLGSSRDGFQHLRPNSLDNSHIMKMFRGTGGPRRPQDEEAFFGMPPIRPNSDSLTMQPATSVRTDFNTPKWERATPISVGPVLHYPPRIGQVVPYGYQSSPNRFKDASVAPSIVSQAADEGSRTGMKGSGILSSINVSGGTSDKYVPSAGKQKLGTNQIAETDSSNSQSIQGVTSATSQMTIFYGGQAHVFDDVHPNKADVIMALAGSNGGSWSTNFTQNSTVRPPPNEVNVPGAENETGIAIKSMFPREFRGRFSIAGNSNQGLGASDRTSIPPGFHEGNIAVKDLKGLNQVAEMSSEKRKHEL